VWNRVKCFTEIEEDSANVMPLFHPSKPLISSIQQGSSSRLALGEAPLLCRYWVMFFKMSSQELTDMLFKELAQDRKEGNWSIVSRVRVTARFGDGRDTVYYMTRPQVLVSSPVCSHLILM